MTFKEKAMEMLTDHGMPEEDAAQVIKQAMAINSHMHGRWTKDVSAYPAITPKLLWRDIRGLALVWIHENCPETWYRAMFVDEPQQA